MVRRVDIVRVYDDPGVEHSAAKVLRDVIVGADGP